ncbi:hypothetical protein OAM93_03235 [Candidatus Pelagibacter sp.]|nr:hypothetical protein [Candidatus Pelagibacter sp.]
MNTNKQLTKGSTMKKMAMVISLLTVIATSANATGWGTNTIWSKPSYNGGHSFYSGNTLLGYSQPSYGGGSIFYFK